jgi:uncharacterized repeat protein (TIGR03803 family)
MKKFTLLNIFCILLATLHAQLQLVSVVYKLSGTSSLKVASFKTDGAPTLLHDFKITDPTDCNGVVIGPGGKLYGTTLTGGTYYNGTLFSVNADGSGFKTIYDYKNARTAIPPATSPDGKLYIVISDSLYKLSADGITLAFITKLAPFCRRVVVTDDQWIYGCGSDGTAGFIFRIKTDGSGYSVLHVFDRYTEGAIDVANTLVCITPTGRLFVTCSSGVNSLGTLASMRTDGSDFQVNKTFSSADRTPYGTGPLTSGAVSYDNGKIIFTMVSGGDYSAGTILSFDTLTSTLSKIFSFPFVAGTRTLNETHPHVINGKLVGLGSKGLYSVALNGMDYQLVNNLSLSGYSILNYEAATNSLIYSANGGAFKNSQVLKTDAGTNINSAVYSFGNIPEGYNPDGIIRTPDGILFGIARNGGSEGGGVLFKMNDDGSGFGIVKDFTGNSGQSPIGQLLYASDERLYGVCKKSGIAGSSDSMLIYGVDVSGNNYAVLRVFETKTDGDIIPELSETSSGEIAGLKTLSDYWPPPPTMFKLNKNGTGFTLLKTFTGAEGFYPKRGLVPYNGFLYGVHTDGGNGAQTNGSIFRIEENGNNFAVVKYFNSRAVEGSYPEGGLTLGSDGKLYGVTTRGGANNRGTAFSLDPANLTFKAIYNLSLSDGFISLGKFTEASDGKLYIPRSGGILGINRDGANSIFIPSPEYNLERNPNGVSYLTEIHIPVTAELCAPTASTILKSGISATNYQWQLNAGVGFVSIADNSNYIGTNTDLLQLSNIPSSWTGYQYRCLADGAVSKNYTLKFVNSWIGTSNTNWENPANWSCGSIPDNNTDVVIDSGGVVVNSNVTVRSLKVATGVNFTVNTGFVLSITH